MKRYIVFIPVLIIVVFLVYYFYPKKVKKVVIDSETLKNKVEDVIVFKRIDNNEELSLKALNELSKDGKKGFTEVPDNIRFLKVVFDNSSKVVTVYAEFRGPKEHLGDFQEYKILLQIFQTVKLNIPESEKFRLVFSGETPFSNIRSDGLYMIEGENIVMVGE
ncbi:MAG: hypothetical protein N3C60_03455 [Calditerrivibrio sp.]|nr:hypothetical protein [Calditerrivibrio sp.]